MMNTCERCGTVSSDRVRACTKCGVALEPPNLEALLVQARAEIEWGHEVAAVRGRLQREGVSEATISRALAGMLLERKARFRKLGMRDLGSGAALVALAVGIFALTRANMESQQPVRMSGRSWGVAFVALGTGCYYLFRGYHRVLGRHEGDTDTG